MSIDRRALLAGGLAGGVAGGALLGAAAVLAAPKAQAVTRPRIHPREDWGARRPKERAMILNRRPDRIVIHHTATPNVTDYRLEAAYRLSRAIQRFHMDSRGWNDIGEQFTISRGGHIMEGRNRTLEAIRRGDHVVGAHVRSHNSHALGIENEGLYMKLAPPERQMEPLIHLVAWICHIYDLDPLKAIAGHRDFNPTDCPGDVLYTKLPELRRRVANRMRDIRSLAAADTPTPTEYPSEVVLETPAPVETPERVALFEHGPAVGPLDPTL